MCFYIEHTIVTNSWQSYHKKALIPRSIVCFSALVETDHNWSKKGLETVGFMKIRTGKSTNIEHTFCCFGDHPRRAESSEFPHDIVHCKPFLDSQKPHSPSTSTEKIGLCWLYPSVRLSLYPSIRLSIDSIRLSVYPFIRLSVYPKSSMNSIRLSALFIRSFYPLYPLYPILLYPTALLRSQTPVAVLYQFLISRWVHLPVINLKII